VLDAEVADLVHDLARRSVTVAVAESLTAGAVTARVADVPGASGVLRGGVVAYATPVKARLLGVDAALLASGGAVQAEVAAQMALGVARVLGASVGLATTGVAGPTPQDGQPVGTVFVALATPGAGGGAVEVEEHAFPGDRATVRQASVDAVLALLARWSSRVKGNARRPPVVD